MAIQSEWVDFGEHTGFLARPERAETPLPAVLVIQEIWGVNAHIEDLTRRFAAAGYAAFAPDLYAPGGHRPAELSRTRASEAMGFLDGAPREVWHDEEKRAAELAKLPGDEGARIGATLNALFSGMATRSDEFEETLLLASRFLRESCEVTKGRKVACVGFCMGGGLSGLLATRDPELSGAVVFYGRPPPEARVADIRCPVLGHYGALDEGITGQVPALAEAMAKAGVRYEHHVYEDAPHAFFNDGRPSYRVKAAREATVRTLGFFRDVLGG